LIRFFLILVIIFSVTSCNINNSVIKQEAISFEKFNEINYKYKADKVIFSDIFKTYYVLNLDLQEIRFIDLYGNELNKIGGLGFQNNNFAHLTDIALGVDGNLLTLDSFKKQIKKYDHYGAWQTTIQIKDVFEPKFLTLDFQSRYYIYDQQRNVILIWNDISDSPTHDFGKFDLTFVSKLSCNDDYLIVNDFQNNSTITYELSGLFDSQANNIFGLERWNRAIEIGQHVIKEKNKDRFSEVFPNGIKCWDIYNQYLTVFDGHKISTFKLIDAELENE
jgi:hypothetical protein